MALGRRRVCLCCLGAIAAGGLGVGGRRARAQGAGIVETILAAAARSPITITRIRPNVAVLEGSGGTVLVATGRGGKVMVDAGIAASRPQMATALAALGPEPVTTLVNTHWHFDHTSGNAWLASLGPRIVAQENARKYLAVAHRVPDWEYEFAPLPDAARPAEVFKEERALRAQGLELELRHYGPAHTDSDISVMLPEADIVHVADTFWNGVYPFIDTSSGGSIDGSIRAAAANLALARESTVIVAGHGRAIGTRADLVAFHDMLATCRDRVAALKRQGRSLPETVAARPTTAYDAAWGGFVVSPALFTRVIYEGV